MTDTTALAARADSDAGGRSRPMNGRQVRRRQPLPTGRAVLGGFLIAIAALGIFVAWTGATRGPVEKFVVAARDLPIGTRLTADDLRLVEMDLPASLAARSAFDSTGALVGVQVINPIKAGELVQASALIDAKAEVGRLEVSFSIEAGRAVGGSLKAGEFIDFLATFGAGSETYTATVLQGSRVLRVDASGGSLGSSDARVITLEVANAEEARAVAHAVNVAKVVLVRSGEAVDKPDQGDIYRAPAANESDG